MNTLNQKFSLISLFSLLLLTSCVVDNEEHGINPQPEEAVVVCNGEFLSGLDSKEITPREVTLSCSIGASCDDIVTFHVESPDIAIEHWKVSHNGTQWNDNNDMGSLANGLASVEIVGDVPAEQEITIIIRIIDSNGKQVAIKTVHTNTYDLPDPPEDSTPETCVLEYKQPKLLEQSTKRTKVVKFPIRFKGCVDLIEIITQCRTDIQWIEKVSITVNGHHYVHDEYRNLGGNGDYDIIVKIISKEDIHGEKTIGLKIHSIGNEYEWIDLKF